MDQTKVRAIEERLLHSQTPADTIENKAELGWLVQKKNPKRTQQLLAEIQQLYEAPDTAEELVTLGRSRYLVIQASLEQNSGRLAESLSQALEAHALLQDTTAVIWFGRVLNLLGMLYLQLGERALATDYWLTFIKLAEKAKLPGEIAKGYNNLGWIALQEQNYAAAFSSFRQASPLLKNASPNNKVLNLCNLAQCAVYLENYEEAAAYLANALAICEKYQLRVEKNVTLQRLALLAEKQGHWDKALHHHLEALTITQTVPDPFSRIPNLHAIGQIYTQLNQLDLAQHYLQEALTLGENEKRKQFLYESHRLLAEMYKKAGDFEKALEHQEQFQQLKEAVFNDKSEQTVQNLQIIHQTQVLKRETELLKKQNELLEENVVKHTRELTESLSQSEQLAQQLQQTLRKESELNQLRRRILDTVSHEFRTPLTVISTSAALLAKKPETLTPERRAEHYNRIKESIFYLTDLLQDVGLVNETANLEGNAPKRTRYQFNHMWPHLKQQVLYELHKPENVVFLYDSQEMYPTKTNFETLKQIVFSLVANALKYSAADKLVTVEVTLEHNEETETIMEIKVHDEGIGIPAAELPNIFDLFYRASNAQTEKGLGVGLYIAQQLTAAINGTLTANSAGENKGSIFTLTIPV